jgi:hypothetical protein
MQAVYAKRCFPSFNDFRPLCAVLESKATAVSASFNGTATETTRDAAGNWIVRAY